MSEFTPAEDPAESVKALVAVAEEFGLGYVTLDTDAVRAVLAQAQMQLNKANGRWHDERNSSAKAETERDDAREIARCLKRMYAPHPDPHGYLAAALGLDRLPDWLTKGY